MNEPTPDSVVMVAFWTADLPPDCEPFGGKFVEHPCYVCAALCSIAVASLAPLPADTWFLCMVCYLAGRGGDAVGDPMPADAPEYEPVRRAGFTEDEMAGVLEEWAAERRRARQ